jgi:hypothetical protein
LYKADMDIFRHDRKDGRAGGGVLLYCKSKLKAKQLTEIESLTRIECIIVRLSLSKHQNIVVVNAYRPPGSPVQWFADFRMLLAKLVSFNNFIVAGDYNIDLMSASSNRRTAQIILNSINCIVPRVFPTRIATIMRRGRQQTSSSCLDIIASSLPSREYKISKITTFGASDHLPIESTLLFEGSNQTSIQPRCWKRKFSNMTEAAVAEFFSTRSTQLDDVLATTDPNVAVDKLESILSDALDFISPLQPQKHSVVSGRAGWESVSLRQSRKKTTSLAKKGHSQPIAPQCF